METCQACCVSLASSPDWAVGAIRNRLAVTVGFEASLQSSQHSVCPVQQLLPPSILWDQHIVRLSLLVRS